MTNQEARAYALRLKDNPNCYCEIVRILPGTIDPIKPNDNGWDVQITYHYDSTIYTTTAPLRSED